MNLSVSLIVLTSAATLAGHAATIPFTFHVDGSLNLLSPPPVIGFHVTGTGTTSAGPIVAYTDNGTINLTVPFPDGTFPLAGNLTMTLLGGDQITASLLEHFVPPDALGNVSGSEVFTVTGGTGRFASATGTLVGFGTGNTGDSSVHFGASGNLTGPNLQATPEPASFALAFFALTALGVFRRSLN